MRYAPLGSRSSGPIRASIYGGADYHAKANDIVVAFGMIETVEAMENLDEILSVQGLDAIYVGPSDLSISLGYNPGGDKPDEWMMAALNKVLDGCKRHKVQPGIHCGAASYAKKMIAMGFTFVTVGGDNRFMTLGGQAAVAEMKDAPKPGAGRQRRYGKGGSEKRKEVAPPHSITSSVRASVISYSRRAA